MSVIPICNVDAILCYVGAISIARVNVIHSCESGIGSISLLGDGSTDAILVAKVCVGATDAPLTIVLRVHDELVCYKLVAGATYFYEHILGWFMVNERKVLIIL